jgi:hypothetical protein
MGVVVFAQRRGQRARHGVREGRRSTSSRIASAAAASASPTMRHLRTQRPVAAEWPLGPVDRHCVDRIVQQPGPCARCQHTLPLIGRSENDEALCGPCAGSPLTYACQRCGRTGDNDTTSLCGTCALSERLTAVLAGHAGMIPDQLLPLHNSLVSSRTPSTVTH